MAITPSLIIVFLLAYIFIILFLELYTIPHFSNSFSFIMLYIVPDTDSILFVFSLLFFVL
jgi:hypothetical protein